MGSYTILHDVEKVNADKYFSSHKFRIQGHPPNLSGHKQKKLLLHIMPNEFMKFTNSKLRKGHRLVETHMLCLHKIDCCNMLYMGLPLTSTQKLQLVQTAVAVH